VLFSKAYVPTQQSSATAIIAGGLDSLQGPKWIVPPWLSRTQRKMRPFVVENVPDIVVARLRTLKFDVVVARVLDNTTIQATCIRKFGCVTLL
jgi:hypothetical protein